MHTKIQKTVRPNYKLILCNIIYVCIRVSFYFASNTGQKRRPSKMYDFQYGSKHSTTGI